MVTPAQTGRLLGPSDKLGKHEVIRAIAVGGVAELYLTRTVGAEGLERLACVKRIQPQYAQDPSFVGTFLNEARLASTLHHPNIAQVFDVGQENGESFFSMEYVHGEDLGRLVTASAENRVPISLDCALTVAAGLCAGLHHAHEKALANGRPLGLVHRDVSPTNIVISYDGAVKLVDFGIARAVVAPAVPSPAGHKGKISYLSPEQARGAAIDRRSDVFSVGTILYQLTTGRLPFIDETEPGVRQQLIHRDAAPPSTLVPGYPPPLEAIVMRALARDPDRRVATALALQSQLEDFAHGNRLRVSPLVLARLMSTLFPKRLEEWDHARAQGAFFVEQHVVRTLIESGKALEAAPRYVPQPLPAAEDASGAVVGPPGFVDPASDPDRTAVGPQPWLQQPAAVTAPPASAANGHPPSPRGAQTMPPPELVSPPRLPRSTSQPPVTVPPARPSRSTLPPPGSGMEPSGPPPASQTSPPPGPALATAAGYPAPLPQATAQSSPASRPSRSTLPPPGLPGVEESAPLRSSPPTSPPPAAAPLTSPLSGTGHPASPRSSQQQASVLSSSLRPARPPSQPMGYAASSRPPSQPGVPTSSRPPSQPGVPTSSRPPSQPTPGAAGTSRPPSQPMASVPGAPRRSSLPLESSPAAGPPAPAPAAGWPPEGMAAGPSLPAPTDDPFQTSPSKVIGAHVGYYPPSPIPSGGTLVSSATVAGNPPPAVRPVPGPYGHGGLDGYAGQSHGTQGGPGMGMRPAPQIGPSQSIPGGPAGERGRVAAVPTMMIRHRSRSRVPLVLLAVVGVAGVAVGVWFTIAEHGEAAPAPSVVQKTAPAPAAAPPSAPTPEVETSAAAADGAPPDPTSANAPGTTGMHADPAKQTAVPAGSAKVARPARPTPALDPAAELSKKPPARAPQPDPRAKPTKAKPRVEPKRASKIQPKEQQWNDDSPFMPVATPKR